MTQPRPDEFMPPPECPVFEPSWEEFSDPFAFINKIRPIAEKTGICKVRPPPDWQPPFACDVDRLHFTPRIQRLNELEAQTRVKLNFLDQIAKFWELQGCTLKIPHVERKILDLYQLNKLVADEGGFDIVCRERRWTRIALKMGFAPGKAVGSHLRAHYERILYPYNLFQSGANLLVPDLSSKLMHLMAAPAMDKCTQKPVLTNHSKDQEYKPHDLLQRQCLQPAEACPPARRAKRMRAEAGCVKSEPSDPSEPPEPCENRPNLRRRMGSLVAKPEPEKELPVPLKQEPPELKDLLSDLEKSKLRYRKSSPAVSAVSVDLYVCLVCGSGSEEERLLLCDGCDDSYHTFCLIPPLQDVPKGDWRCPKCLAQECSKPPEAFGFEQAYRDYSLRMVPTELVEKEFWRLVSTIEEDVTVEYGADIASKEFGSGFPIRNGRFKVSPQDQSYLSCGWNLNNMAMMEPSVLTHVTADICGMKLPWLYVGMCFSSFCWHIEDHWSYSINYLHWGEPKTWYGAPGYAAGQLENVMKKLAPELFEAQPDLLHQLVTIMNPNTLMSHGVPIYRTNQCAGEFVITFPRAYHSGFNQGFNFAEAVNFCTVDWMPLGRQCVDHYRLLHRYCVFSHDEMVCKMALKAASLDVVLASAVQKDMAAMIRQERELRDRVRKMGVVHSEQTEYDLLQDDDRQCAKGALLLPLSNYTLNYRFTLDDLYPMMNAVKQRAESYDQWASNVSEILEAKLDKKRSVGDVEKCSSVAQQLLNGKRQTRYRSGWGKSQSQLTVEELKSFVRQLYNLPCSISQAPLLKDLLNRAEDFQQHSEKVLAEECPGVSEIQALLAVSVEFDVALPELPALRARLEQARWLEGVRQAEATPATLSLDAMRRLIDRGVGLAPHPSVERTMARLQELLTVSERWEDRARGLVRARPPHCLETMATAAQEVESIPAYLPNCLLLRDSVRRAREWLQEAEGLQLGGRVPVLDSLSDLVLRGRGVPVQLGPLARLESLVSEVQAWKESAAKTFLPKSCPYTLLEVLCPRCEVGAGTLRRKPKKAKEAGGPSHGKKKLDCLSDVERALSESKDSASAMSTLAEVRLREMEALCALRVANEARLAPAGGDCSSLRVCVCQRPPVGAMLQCELCRDAFHSACRSERPPLDRVLPLLASLQRLRVRLPEGDALRYLIERTVSWQHRARRVSSSSSSSGRRGSAHPTADTNGSNTKQAMSCPGSAPCAAQEWNRTGPSQTHFYTEQRCIPLQGLSPELEELMVEGLLLQVTLPEIQPLYHGSPAHSEDGVSGLKKEAVNGVDRKTKRRLDRQGPDGECWDRAKKPQKKKPKLKEERAGTARPAPPLALLLPALRLLPLGRVGGRHGPLSRRELDMARGDEVDWVQCDGSCNQWFHQVCVGVTPELAEKEDYVCVRCALQDVRPRK
ncbi:hypothetical protein AAFF_G00170920 [Aldrovandia affinis]|uniref:[histone H3]-trimethyl-L-lysine(4) demethylase n=1 Tax=Aldrovandia affinis TaxID=143900 RepID=A0AAD7RLK6_9TELE|nr:hypothetical protein AAFF_G00170920 [Aldrovandia affinis]